LYCIQSLDYEKQKEYNLTVIATDLGTPPLSSVVNIKVSVIDVADNVPSFSQVLYNVTVRIADGVGKCLLNLTAGNSVTYTITGQAQGSRIRSLVVDNAYFVRLKRFQLEHSVVYHKHIRLSPYTYPFDL
jgi:NifB/MoaA-like Fe-S oxidoreductase